MIWELSLPRDWGHSLRQRTSELDTLFLVTHFKEREGERWGENLHISEEGEGDAEETFLLSTPRAVVSPHFEKALQGLGVSFS